MVGDSTQGYQVPPVPPAAGHPPAPPFGGHSPAAGFHPPPVPPCDGHPPAGPTFGNPPPWPAGFATNHPHTAPFLWNMPQAPSFGTTHLQPPPYTGLHPHLTPFAGQDLWSPAMGVHLHPEPLYGGFDLNASASDAAHSGGGRVRRDRASRAGRVPPSPDAASSRTQSRARKAINIADSSSFGNADDDGTTDNEDGSDDDTDNESSASSTADNADFLGVGGSAAAAQAAAHLQTGAGEPSCVVQGDTADSGGSDAVEVALADLFGRDHEVIPAVKAALALRRRKRQLLKKAILLV